jgi:hypothetical protein
MIEADRYTVSTLGEIKPANHHSMGDKGRKGFLFWSAHWRLRKDGVWRMDQRWLSKEKFDLELKKAGVRAIKWQKRNPEASIKKSIAWAKANKERRKEIGRKSAAKIRASNPEKYRLEQRLYLRSKRKSDPFYRLKANARRHVRRALKGKLKKESTFDLIGCSPDYLKQHLESQMTREMNWDNFGSYWHIDHIQPLSSFDLGNPNQLRLACNWLNLRPMEARANQRKQSAITVPQLHLPLIAA